MTPHLEGHCSLLLLPVTPLSQYWNLQWHFELLQRIYKAYSLNSGVAFGTTDTHGHKSAVMHLALRSVDRSETC